MSDFSSTSIYDSGFDENLEKSFIDESHTTSLYQISPQDAELLSKTASTAQRLVGQVAELESEQGGWIKLVSSTVSFGSSSTINVVGFNATATFTIGDKLEITQLGTIKYFYIYAVTATLLTITGGSDYTFSNNPITLIRYSKQLTPQGFPVSLNYDCNPRGVGTPGNFSLGIGSKIGKFFMIGKTVFFDAAVDLGTLSNPDNVRINLPIAVSLAASPQIADRNLCTITDNFTIATGVGKIDQVSQGQMTLYPFPSFVAFAATVNGFGFYIKYEYFIYT